MSQFAIETDDRLIRRAKNGDQQAFSTLYQLFSKPCYNLALRMSGDPGMAQDVVHDVFIKLIQSIHGFRGDAPFWGWLRRITVNQTINGLRQRKKFVPIDAEFLTHLQDRANQKRDPDPAVAYDADALLARLPAQARAIVHLYAVEGYSHREIAAMFGQSESYSKSIVSRSFQRLRKLLPGAD